MERFIVQSWHRTHLVGNRFFNKHFGRREQVSKRDGVFLLKQIKHRKATKLMFWDSIFVLLLKNQTRIRPCWFVFGTSFQWPNCDIIFVTTRNFQVQTSVETAISLSIVFVAFLYSNCVPYLHFIYQFYRITCNLQHP